MHVKSLRPVVKVISSSPPASSSSLTAVWTSSVATSNCCEIFNRKWVRLSQRDVWRNYKPRCKPGAKGWVKSSYLASKKRYECQWSSLTRAQLSQGVGGVRACPCLWMCVIIRLRQGWWGACAIVKCAPSVCLFVLTGRETGHRAPLTWELLRHWVRCHQGEQTGSLCREGAWRVGPGTCSPNTVTSM